LREEEHVGDYAQPRWSASRRFPTTRVYVVPKGKIEFEWWMKYQAPTDDLRDGRTLQSMWEFELGLGHRLQLDLYWVGEQQGFGGAYGVRQEKVELRYALADWGKLWGNPTLYAEWTHADAAPDRAEAKLLLGGEVAPRWHSGLNLVFERELSG